MSAVGLEGATLLITGGTGSFGHIAARKRLESSERSMRGSSTGSISVPRP